MTRANAQQSAAILASRHADDAEPEQRVTAEEWLQARRDSDTAEDPHREITEAEVSDDHAAELRALYADRPRERRDADVGEPVAETGLEDIRDTVAREPAPRREDDVRVPEVAETDDALDRAQRTLDTVAARTADEAREQEEHRAAELARWHGDDRQAAEELAVGSDLSASRDDADGGSTSAG